MLVDLEDGEEGRMVGTYSRLREGRCRRLRCIANFPSSVGSQFIALGQKAVMDNGRWAGLTLLKS